MPAPAIMAVHINQAPECFRSDWWIAFVITTFGFLIIFPHIYLSYCRGRPDALRAIYPAEIRNDGILCANGGDTWIALVEWDSNGNRSADVIHQFGAAILDEGSPHYAHPTKLFVEKKWRKALLDRAEIQKITVRI